jgi:flagellar biosynthesis/type III secretory pathway protein FliH
MKLSDAFERVEGNENVNLELTVKAFNIGKGRNEEIARKCGHLGGYVDFVALANARQTELKRENPGMDRKLVLEKAIADTVSYCKRHGILEEFFGKLLPEEVNMLAQEWDYEEELRVREEEGWEKGLEQGLEKGLEQGLEQGLEKSRDLFSNLMKQAGSMGELQKMFEASFSRQSLQRG